jgi:hypothetical protein
MADLTVTAANVAPGTDATIERNYNAGATITAGQTVYLSTTTNTWLLADANLSQAAAVLGGVALNGAASGQPLAVLTRGNLNPGATAVVGMVYVLSGTAGGIAPVADGVTGWYTSILGIGTTASNIAVNIQVSNVAKP